MKRAQSISMNVIIIAAIALLVLVILSVIFMGRMGIWGKSVDDCVNKGGQCNYNPTTGCPAEYTHYAMWSCPSDTETVKYCCIKA
jgi:hypothetical protein